MSTQENYLKRIPIFLASPSDLSRERKLFSQVIEYVNATKAKSKGILFEANVWEDCLIGKGRPQEKINEKIKQSNLLVFILWKRWGSDTGEFSSGFEEEYKVACSENKDILFFFREIPIDMLEDPGGQLKKVIEFKNKIEKEKKYLYKPYQDENEWEKIFSFQLYTWLDQMRSEDSIKSTEDSSKLETEIKIDISPKEREVLEDKKEINHEKIINDDEIQLEDIVNPIIRKENEDLHYFKIETKQNMGCYLFGDFSSFSKGTYCFHAPQKSFVTLGELEKVLKVFYNNFDATSNFFNPSFIINQTCFDNNLNYSWFGFGPKNFIQAFKEQSKRYSEAGIAKPHHREVAGFMVSVDNFIFYIALQPDFITENAEPTFDYMQVGFIFSELPFNNRKFRDFYKKAGLEEPNFIEEKNLNIVEKDLTNYSLNLNKEGFVVYRSFGEYWVSKVILENPFYGKKEDDEYLFLHEKIVVNISDHHQLDMKKDYFLNKLLIMPIPYYNFPFVALRFLGNW